MTDRTHARHASGWAPLMSVLALALAAPVAVAGQDDTPLFLVNDETRVSSVEFDFKGRQSIESGTLRGQIVFRGPGTLHGVKEFFDFLPFVSSPSLELFTPPELFRDMVRLERFYQSEGFPDASVGYRASLDLEPNTIDVTFVVDEGEPLILDSVVVLAPDGTSLQEHLPPELQAEWPGFLSRLREQRGERLSSALRLQIQDQVSSWLRDRGYPYPAVGREVGDSGGEVRLTITARPGPRMRVGEVGIQGNERLAEDVLRKGIPLESRDWYSQQALASGQSSIMGLEMIQFAITDTEARSQADSVVDVSVRVDEGALHLLTSRLGYGTQSGISGDVTWSHRNFLGGARVLEITGVARTGLLALSGPDWLAGERDAVVRRYGLSALVRQPFFLSRRLEGLLRPFSEYRDDYRVDRSVEVGTEASLLFNRGPHRNVSLRYAISNRWILETRGAGPIGAGERLVDVIQAVDTLDLDRQTSSLVLSSRWGRPFSFERLQRGWSLSGSGEITGPPALSSVEYGKILAEASGDLPFAGGLVLSGSVGFGRLFPYGVSIPLPDGTNRLEVYLELRDAILTAGGAQGVRGWGEQLLGPKLPDLSVRTEEGDTVFRAGQYVPLGGLARWTASVQFGFPLPFVGRPHGMYLFLDGGRVWTPDRRFLPTEDPLVPGQAGGQARFGTGLGVLFSTPVGPVEVALGYKLNPSLLDVRDPKEVADALGSGTSIESVPESFWRRLHLHFSIGRGI